MGIFNGLHFNNLKGDIYGGLTAAVVALPLAMAMGVASGVGAVAGLYGAIFVGFFAALFGGTPSQVSGPTGPMTVVMAAIFTQYTGMFPDNPAHGAALAFTVVMLGGLFQIAFGLLKFGKFIELVPHPVVSGFMSGIGVIIILLQFAPLVGQPSISRPLAAAIAMPDNLQQIEYHALELGVLVLLMVYGIPRYLPRFNRLIPAHLFALISGTLFYLLFMEPGITPIIGNIPTGFPQLSIPTIDAGLALDMLGSSLTLASLGAIDSLLTSLVADNITRTQHKSDRELIGQGIGNMVAGLFGGLPGAGATMRTVVNVKAGGRTPISGALHALVLLATVLGAGVMASQIPLAVLAGILIKVGTDIIDWDYLRRLRQAPASGIVIMLTVFIVTVTIDLLLAVGIGMVMASFIFMHRMTRMQVDSIRAIKKSEGVQHLSQEEADILDSAGERILLFSMSGPMSFSSARGMVRRHAEIAGYEVMLLDLTEVHSVDFTTSLALQDIIIDTYNSRRQLFLVGAQKAVKESLERFGVTAHVQADGMFPQRLDALRRARDLLGLPGTTQTAEQRAS
jgi:SulP family sulfate permease